MGQRVTPLQRVGVYVPGGTAPLPSSLLMAVIPARVAGVDQVFVCTPPGGSQGRVPQVTLAAAHVAGVDRLFRLGGAQAIAALAYGTDSVPRVDKIVGAGGLFTTLAKRQVYGLVGLDGLYGPTETVVVADASANPAWVAADLLAQAEHDALATAILLTPSRQLAEAVQREITRQLEPLSRADVVAASLAGQGGIVLTPNLATAVRLADEFAPEHLCLSIQEPEIWADRIRNAGGLFLGEHSFEVLGDYVAGPSHIMPTGGTARFSSPVNVLDFVKIVNVIALDPETAAHVCPAAARLARAESLTAHAAAAAARQATAGNLSSSGPGVGRPNVGAHPCGRPNMAVHGGDSTTEFEGPTHPYLEQIEPYQPPDLEEAAARAGRDVEHLVRLDLNENPFGPSPRVAQALADYPGYAYYPDYQALQRAVARYAGLTPEQVVLSNGADELIDLTTRLFVEPGQGVVICPPTFSMYRFYARVNRCRALPVPRRADFSNDVAAIEATVQKREGNARLLFLVSPGNPDGQVIPLATIRRLLALPLTVVVDEAYIEFGGESAVPLLADHENLVVIRTFSKWAGMAGLRLGYALLAPKMAGYLNRVRAPFNVNAAAERAALATFEDLENVQANVACLIRQRERLQEALAAFSWLEPLPSQANFILCRVKGRPAQEVTDALAWRGILIRRFSSPAMAGYVRISVGRPDQNDLLLETLQELDDGKQPLRK
jgi:histidinol dehydrogenase